MFSVMADPQIVGTLQRKRDDIERVIAEYEKKIEAAKRDLSHVNATLAMFVGPEGRTQFPVYMETLRLFRRGEIVTICKAALAKEGPLDTRELAVRVVKAKGLDAKDTVLRRSVAFRIVQAMRLQATRRILTQLPRRKGVSMWKLP
ncbi:MAG TPA: hypothetical protein VGH84_15195 [Steroidobacteraceae bacterium]|jgi:hypothetical protein